MGVCPAEIEARRKRRLGLQGQAEPGFGVLRENWLSFSVFLALAGQWNIIAGFGGVYYEDINYAVLPIIEKRMGVKKRQRAKVFNDLRVLVAAAKPILNAQ